MLHQKQSGQNVKRSPLVKENQTSQVKELSTFLSLGRCESLGSLKSFFQQAPQVPRASTMFFPILSPLRVHHWGQLMGLAAGSSFVSIRSSLRAHGQGCLLQLDGCNNICLRICQQWFPFTSSSLISDSLVCPCILTFSPLRLVFQNTSKILHPLISNKFCTYFCLLQESRFSVCLSLVQIFF